MNQSEYRKRLLALIHINPLYKQIVENGAWQEWLMLRFGVESSKELSISELNLALDILQERVDDRLALLNSSQATKIITGLSAVIKCEKNPKKS